MADADVQIYTWRNLPHPQNSGAKISVVWNWGGWVHFREHLRESGYSLVASAGIPEPVRAGLRNLDDVQSAEEARPALQRLADWLRASFQQELQTPRVVFCRTMPGRVFATILVGESGLRFVLTSRDTSRVKSRLTTLYFARWLRDENYSRRFRSTATDQEVAIRELVAKYTNGTFRLPGAGVFVERDKCRDDQIHFVEPAAWGFPGDQEGTRWNAFLTPRSPSPARPPVTLDPRPDPAADPVTSRESAEIAGPGFADPALEKPP